MGCTPVEVEGGLRCGEGVEEVRNMGVGGLCCLRYRSVGEKSNCMLDNVKEVMNLRFIGLTGC